MKTALAYPNKQRSAPNRWEKREKDYLFASILANKTRDEIFEDFQAVLGTRTRLQVTSYLNKLICKTRKICEYTQDEKWHTPEQTFNMSFELFKAFKTVPAHSCCTCINLAILDKFFKLHVTKKLELAQVLYFLANEYGANVRDVMSELYYYYKQKYTYEFYNGLLDYNKNMNYYSDQYFDY